MISIEQWVWRYFQNDVQTYGSPATDLRVNCPFCLSRYGKMDYEKKLYVSVVKHACHCFRCDYSASWVGLVMDAAGMSYVDAMAELYVVPKARDFHDLMKSAKEVKKEDPLKDFRLLSEDNDSDIVYVARSYMRRRGYGPDVWSRYGIGVSLSMPNRVVIPIEDGVWQARAVYPWMEPKYLSSKQENRHALFNAKALRLYDEVVICEGAFSAMRVGKNAIAIMGNKATREQFDRLRESDASSFIVALDSDAKRNAVNLGRQLRRIGRDVTLWLYDEGDPADSEISKTVIPTWDIEIKARLDLL